MICCGVAMADVEVISGVIKVNGSTLRIDGHITPKLAIEFREALTHEIKTIEVNSAGGVTIAGLDMGTLMLGKGLTLIVDGECMSACASYLFLAAKQKILKPNAVVAWHAGILPALSTTLLAVEKSLASGCDIEENLEKSRILIEEVFFYKKAGVNLMFPYYQGLVTAGHREKNSELIQTTVDGKAYKGIIKVESEYNFWSPDLAEFTKYGVENVSVIPSRTKQKRQERNYRYFGGNKIYLGKAYSYIPLIIKQNKIPLYFDWKKFHELEIKAAKLATKHTVSDESIGVSQEKRADQ